MKADALDYGPGIVHADLLLRLTVTCQIVCWEKAQRTSLKHKTGKKKKRKKKRLISFRSKYGLEQKSTISLFSPFPLI